MASNITQFDKVLNPDDLKEVLRPIHNRVYEKINDFALPFQDVHRQIIFAILKCYNYSLEDLYHYMKTRTAVHPVWHQKLLKFKDDDGVLSEKYIRTDKLIRILKNNPTENVEYLLAIDGLSGNLSAGPNFDYKRYLNNLVVGPEGERIDNMDYFPDYKRKHVQTIRKLYILLRKHTSEPGMEKHIYIIMKQIIQDEFLKELPTLEDGPKALPEDVYMEAIELYDLNMKENEVRDLVNSLRWRGEKRCSDEEETIKPLKCKRNI